MPAMDVLLCCYYWLDYAPCGAPRHPSPITCTPACVLLHCLPLAAHGSWLPGVRGLLIVGLLAQLVGYCYCYCLWFSPFIYYSYSNPAPGML